MYQTKSQTLKEANQSYVFCHTYRVAQYHAKEIGHGTKDLVGSFGNEDRKKALH